MLSSWSTGPLVAGPRHGSQCLHSWCDIVRRKVSVSFGSIRRYCFCTVVVCRSAAVTARPSCSSSRAVETSTPRFDASKTARLLFAAFHLERRTSVARVLQLGPARRCRWRAQHGACDCGWMGFDMWKGLGRKFEAKNVTRTLGKPSRENTDVVIAPE